MPQKVEDVTARVVRILFEAGAFDWTIKDKGVFMAAVKLQLAERSEQPRNEWNVSSVQ